MREDCGYDGMPFLPVNKNKMDSLHSPAPYRNSYLSTRDVEPWLTTIILVIIATHATFGCTTKLAPISPTPTIESVVPTTYPPCSTDHRGRYTIIEVPKITDTAQAPSAFFSLLHEAIMEEGRQRDIYHVVPKTSEQDAVVRLTMFVESWAPDIPLGSHSGVLSIKLFLIDKKHQCLVGQTTGYGKIRHDPENGFTSEDIRTIAESAGWFVGMTLMHDP